LAFLTPAGSAEGPVPPGTARHTVPVSCPGGQVCGLPALCRTPSRCPSGRHAWAGVLVPSPHPLAPPATPSRCPAGRAGVRCGAGVQGCSELFGGLHRQAAGPSATVPHPQTPPAAHSRSPPPDFASTASCPTSRLATPAPLRRSKACELDLAGYGSLSRMMPWLAGTPSPQSLAPAPAPGRDTRCSWLCLHR